MKKSGTSMVGSREVDCTSLIDTGKKAIHKINSSFCNTKGGEVLGNTSLPFYGAFVSEEKQRLFGDVSKKKVLEIGCGTGHLLAHTYPLTESVAA
jgi:2-polyprenyl-3-methyl-5-hydroxy-6-metoxy-1,4-benzoquinol methylase